MADYVETIIVGAGVVGLAIARSLAASGRDVLVIEKEDRIGSETSSRNSEVIHAGIYYPPQSMKAALCVEGKSMLYRYCADRGIPHRRCGKLIVAASVEEVQDLRRIQANGAASGVTDLELLDGDAARALEPNLRCVAALLSPSTGIVDSHQFMLALEGDITATGGTIALKSRFRTATPTKHGFRTQVDTPEVGGFELDCGVLINAGGLHAQSVAGSILGMPKDMIPNQFLAKGSYFVLGGRPPFERLIYPLPTAASLGLHYSVDLGGQTRFGPDVEWVDEIDYGVSADGAVAFETSIRRYYPALPQGTLSPGYAGVRPKIVGPGAPAGDFVIQGPQAHGVRSLFNLFGIESPGLTSSMAIGRHIAALIAET
ncbi:MAG: NAD(P)/FAD-dependent oxidoreductase [Proteobacteria bacterium]|nr:NAD(P)/FAD-dependent oxidoreductase [Pseudomonadota bacterium]